MQVWDAVHACRTLGLWRSQKNMVTLRAKAEANAAQEAEDVLAVMRGQHDELRAQMSTLLELNEQLSKDVEVASSRACAAEKRHVSTLADPAHASQAHVCRFTATIYAAWERPLLQCGLELRQIHTRRVGSTADTSLQPAK